MKNLLVIMVMLLLSISASSQILKPVKWSYAAKKTSSTEATIFIKASMEKGWHIYSQKATEGPVKTTFAFLPEKSFQLIEKVTEPKPIVKFEKAFGTDVSYFENTVVFQQKIKLVEGEDITVKGNVEFMICSERQCLPPETIEFAIPIK